MSRPALTQINLVCRDVAASMAFYRRLGVEIPETAIWRTPSGEHHVSAVAPSAGQVLGLDLDSTAFAQYWNAGWNGQAGLGGRVVVGFDVPTREAVDDLFHRMTSAGYHGLQEPYDAMWGSRYAIVEDSDGIAVGLMSPVSPGKKSPPPDL